MFPLKDKDWKMQPINKEIFEKMIFCDQKFESIELEESLYFTSLDIEFHSNKIENSDDLYRINFKHFA